MQDADNHCWTNSAEEHDNQCWTNSAEEYSAEKHDIQCWTNSAEEHSAETVGIGFALYSAEHSGDIEQACSAGTVASPVLEGTGTAKENPAATVLGKPVAVAFVLQNAKTEPVAAVFVQQMAAAFVQQRAAVFVQQIAWAVPLVVAVTSEADEIASTPEVVEVSERT